MTTHTLASVRALLTDYPGENGSYARYLELANVDLLRHFKAGVNAAWRENYDLARDETRYERKHGRAAGDAFTDGFVYSAAYL